MKALRPTACRPVLAGLLVSPPFDSPGADPARPGPPQTPAGMPFPFPIGVRWPRTGSSSAAASPWTTPATRTGSVCPPPFILPVIPAHSTEPGQWIHDPAGFFAGGTPWGAP